MKKGKLSQRSQNIIIISVLLAVVNITLGFFLTRQSNNALTDLMQGRMLDIANSAADLIDGDELERLTADDKDSEEYRKVLSTLSCFLDNIELEYIYCVRDMGNKNFVFTVDPEPDDPGEFGSPVAYTDALYQASLGTAAVDKFPYEDRWGRFYSAYSPVFNSKGQVAGIVAVDFSAEWYESKVAEQLRTIIIICALSVLAGGSIVVILTEQTRSNYRHLYEHLSDLAENIEVLTLETGGAAKANELPAGEGDDGGEKKHNAEIGDLCDKILSMQEMLKGEIAVVHQQAHTDALTSVGNRTAYLDVVKELDESISKGDAVFSVAVFDINGLKVINDNFGHEYGDMALVDAANLLKKVFDEDSIFRVGGDEFIVIINTDRAEDVEWLFKKADNALAEENKEPRPYRDPLSLSKGYSIYVKGEDAEFREVFKRADDNMYMDKDAYYARFPDKHRR